MQNGRAPGQVDHKLIPELQNFNKKLKLKGRPGCAKFRFYTFRRFVVFLHCHSFHSEYKKHFTWSSLGKPHKTMKHLFGQANGD